MRFLALALLFAMQASLPPGARVVDRGDQSGVDDAKQVVVRTPAEWNALWRVHGMDRPQPKADFSRETIVGIFMGSRPTAGYKLDIVGIDEANGARVVKYREQKPPRDAMTAQVLTSPYVIVAIPKAAGDVRFEKVE